LPKKLDCRHYPDQVLRVSVLTRLSLRVTDLRSFDHPCEEPIIQI
jgi:hypothetical protein